MYFYLFIYFWVHTYIRHNLGLMHFPITKIPRCVMNEYRMPYHSYDLYCKHYMRVTMNPPFGI